MEKQVENFANGANVKEVGDDDGNYQGRSGPLHAIRASTSQLADEVGVCFC